MPAVRERASFSVAVWDLFRSVRLTVVVLTALAVLAIAGTVIPQGAAPQSYELLYGRTGALLVRVAGLNDAYHSTWFLLLLDVLFLNLVACTWDRLPAVLRRYRRPGLARLQAPGTVQVTLPRPPGEAAAVRDTLGQRLGASWTSPERWAEGETAGLGAVRARHGHLAFPLTHVSLLLILLGGLVSGLFAVEGELRLAAGESTDRFRMRQGGLLRAERPLGFELECEDVQVVRDPDSGRPLQYTSDLVARRDGQELARQTISVNTPFDFGGWTFYQSSYDEAPAGMMGRRKTVTGLRVAADPGTPVVWLGSGLLVLGMFLALLAQPRRLRLEVRADAVRLDLAGKGGKAALEEQLQQVQTRLTQGAMEGVE